MSATELSIMDCKICCSRFNNAEHRPMSGICGHTLCFPCSVNVQMGICPFCKLSNSFYKASPNFLVLEMLVHPLDNKEAVAYENIAAERQELVVELNDYIDRLTVHIDLQKEEIRELRKRNREVTNYVRQLEGQVADKDEEIYRKNLFPESIYESIQMPTKPKIK